jgi:gluconolactonase
MSRPVVLRTIGDVQIFDERMAPLALPTSTVRRLGGGAIWSEGPLYLLDGSVIWSDIPNNRILMWKDGNVTEWMSPSNFTNGRTHDREGRIVHCSHGARAVIRTELDGTLTTLVDRYNGHRLNSPNDVVVKRDGTIWFTDPPYGIRSNYEGYQADSEQAGNFVYRFDPDSGELTAVITDMSHPNGLAFSPDESLLYVSDTSIDPYGDEGFHHIMVYDVVDGLATTNGRVFAVIEPGCSDGFRLDTEGNIYTSSLDAIQVFAPDATYIGRIPIPEKIANCCWGGPDRRTLFITASTSLYAIDLNASDVA